MSLKRLVAESELVTTVIRGAMILTMISLEKREKKRGLTLFLPLTGIMNDILASVLKPGELKVSQ